LDFTADFGVEALGDLVNESLISDQDLKSEFGLTEEQVTDSSKIKLHIELIKALGFHNAIKG
jgi:hypothetical protein